jgi:hypothetical protein
VDKTRLQELHPLLNHGRHQIRDYVAANLSALVLKGKNEFERAAFDTVSVV